MRQPHHITFAFWVAKHSLVTFLKEPREVRLVSFSFRAEIHPHLYCILFRRVCQCTTIYFISFTSYYLSFLKFSKLSFQLIYTIFIAALGNNDFRIHHFGKNLFCSRRFQPEKLGNLRALSGNIFGKIGNNRLFMRDGFCRRFFIAAFYRRFFLSSAIKWF